MSHNLQSVEEQKNRELLSKQSNKKKEPKYDPGAVKDGSQSIHQVLFVNWNLAIYTPVKFCTESDWFARLACECLHAQESDFDLGLLLWIERAGILETKSNKSKVLIWL